MRMPHVKYLTLCSCALAQAAFADAFTAIAWKVNGAALRGQQSLTKECHQTPPPGLILSSSALAALHSELEKSSLLLFFFNIIYADRSTSRARALTPSGRAVFANAMRVTLSTGNMQMHVRWLCYTHAHPGMSGYRHRCRRCRERLIAVYYCGGSESVWNGTWHDFQLN